MPLQQIVLFRQSRDHACIRRRHPPASAIQHPETEHPVAAASGQHTPRRPPFLEPVGPVVLESSAARTRAVKTGLLSTTSCQSGGFPSVGTRPSCGPRSIPRVPLHSLATLHQEIGKAKIVGRPHACPCCDRHSLGLVSTPPRFNAAVVDSVDFVLRAIAPPRAAMADRSPRYAVLDALFQKRTCAACDSSQTLVCPACPDNTFCQFITPTDCTECPRATCVANAQVTSSSSSERSSSNVGPIAGGVVGGIAALAVVVFCIWRFCIRSKRPKAAPVNLWEQDVVVSGGAAVAEKNADLGRENRHSTHTTHSVASSVLTRASNIIQIAYIPGVTNRATPTSPALLVPPVPPIPINLTQPNSPSTPDDQHFFVPGSLRDSSYSALSGYSDRMSYARTSYAPRSSVASTIYGKTAVIVAPAQTGMRAKPAMVSVKSANSGATSDSTTPPVPTVDLARYNDASPMPSPALSEFSVGSTFLNANASTAKSGRPLVIKVGNPQGATLKPSPLGRSQTFPAELEAPASPALVEVTSEAKQGPFSDPVELPDDQSIAAASVASSIKEPPSPGPRQQSPFGDQHATSK